MKKDKVSQCAKAMMVAEIKFRRIVTQIQKRESILYQSLINSPVNKPKIITQKYLTQKELAKQSLKFYDTTLSQLYEKKIALKNRYKSYQKLLYGYCRNYNCDIKKVDRTQKKHFKYKQLLYSYDEVIEAVDANKNVYLYSQDIFGMGVAMKHAQGYHEYGMSFKQIYREDNIYYIKKKNEKIIFDRLFFFENIYSDFLIK